MQKTPFALLLATFQLSVLSPVVLLNVAESSSYADENTNSTVQLENLNMSSALNFLHHVNSLEVQQAQQALKKLQNQKVRDYAEMLIHDHQSAEQSVSQLATSKNVNLSPFQAATFEQSTNDQLNGIPAGPAFDRAFMQLQLEGHQRVLQDLNSMLSSVTDPQVQNLLNATLPMIKSHIQKAQEILKELPSQ